MKRNLSLDDDGRRNRQLHCQMGSKAESAVGVGNFTLSMPVSDRQSARHQYERNTQHTEKGSPSRLQKLQSVSAQHISTILAGEIFQAKVFHPTSPRAETDLQQNPSRHSHPITTTGWDKQKPGRSSHAITTKQGGPCLDSRTWDERMMALSSWLSFWRNLVLP